MGALETCILAFQVYLLVFTQKKKVDLLVQSHWNVYIEIKKTNERHWI